MLILKGLDKTNINFKDGYDDFDKFLEDFVQELKKNPVVSEIHEDHIFEYWGECVPIANCINHIKEYGLPVLTSDETNYIGRVSTKIKIK